MDKHKTIVDCFIEAFVEIIKPQLIWIFKLAELKEENSDEKEINKLD